jgi:predicted ATPase
MGFGVSTALPILVAGLVAERNGLLVIENPEIHLHPAGQSAIGEFLAKVAADGVQVLVETHSDHVINGMRRAVAESELPARDAVLHYFDDAVTEIAVDERGKLSTWPAGFFDQIDRDLGAIALRQRRR